MVTDEEVLTRLRRLCQGLLTLDAFEAWYVQEIWGQDTSLTRQVTNILTDVADDVPDERIVRDLVALLPVPALVVDTTGWFASTSQRLANWGAGTAITTERLIPA
jgi:hypothetical protein